MSFIASDLDYYYSGGASNDDPALSIGGTMSSVALVSDTLGNLLDHIFQTSRDVGATDGTTPDTKDYRVIYMGVSGSATGQGLLGKLWMSANDSIAALGYKLAVGTKNTAITAPADENTPPAGLTFYEAPTTQETGLDLPDMDPGDYIGICIERRIGITSDTQNTKGPTLSCYWATN